MQRGFSLVELSIVLVILGLLTGGILAGQSLIRASELRAVASEYQRYTTAIMSFRDKYMALPGDMTNATSFWGTAASCPGNNATPSTTAATCNGNGNGIIYYLDTSTASNEVFRSWQQLANAGLVEGNYTGVANSATATATAALIGTNVPTSKMSNAGWTIYGYLLPVPVADLGFFEGDYGNFFIFGGSAGATVTLLPVLKPEEAWGTDTKLDDGRPAVGKIRSFESQGSASNTGCSDLAASSTNSLSASAYSLSNTGISCSLVMKMQ